MPGHHRRNSVGNSMPGVNMVAPAEKGDPEDASGTRPSRSSTARRAIGLFSFLQDTKLHTRNTETLNCQMMMAATTKGVPLWHSIVLLMFPLGLVIVQLLLMSSFYAASTWIPCQSNTDCRVGEFCETNLDRCYDCAAYNWSSCSEGPQMKTAIDWCAGVDTATGITIPGATADQFPSRCDFLVRSAFEASGMDRFAIAVLSFLLAGALAQELDEDITEHAILHYRASANFKDEDGKGMQRKVVLFFGWIIFRLQAYVLPFYIIGAVTSLVVVGRLVITKVLVDFLAIAFILDADTILRTVFLHPDVGGKTVYLIDEMNTVGMRLGWFASRVYVTAQTLFLISFILAQESYMNLVTSYYAPPLLEGITRSLAAQGITKDNSIIAPCNTILNSLNFVTLVISSVGALGHTLYLTISAWPSSTNPGRLAMLADVIITPLVGAVAWYILIEVQVSDRGAATTCDVWPDPTAVAVSSGGHH